MTDTPRRGLCASATVTVLALALSLALAPAATANRSDATNPPTSERRLQHALEHLVGLRGGPPGVSVVLRRGKRETFVTAGVADVENGRPFKPQKHMRVASVSKAFSGAVALSLVDRGMLSLDDTIAARLPTLPAAWGTVTLRDLLQHTGGLPDFAADPGYQQQLNEHLHGPFAPRSLIEFVADQPLDFPPGSSYHYSNTDNVAIALMAEAATSQSYGTLLRELVFDRLDLKRTRLPIGFRLPNPLIHGYDTNPLEDISECCSMSYLWASGGLFSTPHELNHFTRAYAGGKLFGGATRAQQLSFIPGGASEPPGPGRNSAGLGLFRYETNCGTIYGHTGNFPGYTQFSAATRSGRRSVTVSANRQLAPQAPGKHAPEVFVKLRRDYARAVCALLG